MTIRPDSVVAVSAAFFSLLLLNDFLLFYFDITKVLLSGSGSSLNSISGKF